jgi:curved DNA-binding protein CbpA
VVFVVDAVLKNHYDILGIPPNASKEQIKSAYRKLSLKFHPDKNNGESYFELMFKNINEAHEVLMNDAKRADYDFQFKQFSDSENNSYARQAEMRQREEELRRKQEELLRKEQELKSQQYKSGSTPVAAQPDSEINWDKVINFFLIANVLLIGLIFITTDKNDKVIKQVSISAEKKTNTARSNLRAKKNYEESKSQSTDTLDYPVDSSKMVKSLPTTQ